MNVVALIIWFSAAAGRLLFRAARLIEHTSGFQGAAATCLPVSVISARPAPPWRIRQLGVARGR